MKHYLLALSTLLIAGAALAETPTLTVHKDPNCGCCTAWADLAAAEGYHVVMHETSDMDRVKQRLGVPANAASCHTAEIDGYVIEGHVPIALIDRVLTERPAITGIAVPGMPAGSPGMGDDPEAVYDVVSFGGEAGAGQLYHKVGPAE